MSKTKSCPNWNRISKTMFHKGFDYIHGTLHEGGDSVCVQGALLIGMDPDASEQAEGNGDLSEIRRMQDVVKHYGLPKELVSEIPSINDSTERDIIDKTVFSWLWLQSDEPRMDAIRLLRERGEQVDEEDASKIQFDAPAFERLKKKLPEHFRQAIARVLNDDGDNGDDGDFVDRTDLSSEQEAAFKAAAYEVLVPTLDRKLGREFQKLRAVCSIFKGKAITSRESCKLQKLPRPRKTARDYFKRR